MPATPDRPNIVFILTDDQGPWALGCSGNPEIRTPNLDRLARRGVYFENFFCTSPVCSPARASVMTGRIPSQHGVHDWIRGGNMPPDTKGRRAIPTSSPPTGTPSALAASGTWATASPRNTASRTGSRSRSARARTTIRR